MVTLADLTKVEKKQFKTKAERAEYVRYLNKKPTLKESTLAMVGMLRLTCDEPAGARRRMAMKLALELPREQAAERAAILRGLPAREQSRLASVVLGALDLVEALRSLSEAQRFESSHGSAQEATA